MMLAALPDHLVAYKRTPIFDQDSVPAGLRRQHATKAGVWALIVVLEGQLRLRILADGSQHILDPQTPGVVSPQQAHEVEPVGPMSFLVEFYEEPGAVPPATKPMPVEAARPDSAGREELIASLNELLEAERAGARVALETARASPAPAIAKLMRHIQQDEGRWCAMLLRRLKGLGAIASPRMGAFYEKAMAIDDLAARIAFLNRGQEWVVRKLRELIPRVGDASLHADLEQMLSAHVANIALVRSADTGTLADGVS